MKGITHFLTGVALATCFPEVVALARQGSLLPVLGGLFGLLPDTLDFKFAQYWETYDVTIDPGMYLGSVAKAAGDVDHSGAEAAEVADYIVEMLAGAMRRAYETGSPVNLITHTVRMGADLWRRYSIRLNPEEKTVAARVGPLVSTGQLVYPGTELPAAEWSVRRLEMPVAHAYRRQYDVDAFTGPSFRFVRRDDALVVRFLDWHHRWTHSLFLAVGLGALVTLLGGAVGGLSAGARAGVVAGLAYAAHVLEDQMGHMGCNLFWPLTQRRIPGLKLLHSGDAAPNFLVVWTALVVMLLNLDRWGGPSLLPPLRYGLIAIGGAWSLWILTRLYRRLRYGTITRESRERSVAAERIAEAQDAGFG
jgi:membrane-bound metal-dependent hydrolase YbcI (DUF457 family)